MIWGYHYFWKHPYIYIYIYYIPDHTCMQRVFAHATVIVDSASPLYLSAVMDRVHLVPPKLLPQNPCFWKHTAFKVQTARYTPYKVTQPPFFSGSFSEIANTLAE